MVKKFILTLVFSFSVVVWSSTSIAAACSGGSADAGKYPNQYEVSEYESAAGCSMSFAENPNIASINATIVGNGALGSVNDRLPSEPLVVVPYDSVGSYGGTFRMLSNATEAGSLPIFCFTNSTPTLSDQICNWSIAAALKVSAAPTMTFNPIDL